MGRYFSFVQKLKTAPPTHDDVLRAMVLRATDLQLLHAVLARMLDEPSEAELFSLLEPLEVLFEIKANLTEYADDVLSCRHNSYHHLVRLYGEEAPEYMQTELTRYSTMFQERLAKASRENQARLRVMMEDHERDYPSVPIPQPILDVE